MGVEMGHARRKEWGGWEQGGNGWKISSGRLDGMLLRVGMVGTTIAKHGVDLVTCTEMVS